MTKKIKLSPAQQKLVDYMNKHNIPVNVSTGGMTASAYFLAHNRGGEWDKENNYKGPLFATVFALLNKGVLVLNTAEDAPWYRRDYHLTEEWKDEKE